MFLLELHINWGKTNVLSSFLFPKTISYLSTYSNLPSHRTNTVSWLSSQKSHTSLPENHSQVDHDLFCFYLQTGYLGIKDINWFLYMYLCIREEHILTSDVLSHSQEDRWAQRKGYAPGFGGPAEGKRRPGLPAILKCQTQAVGSTGDGQSGGEEAMVGMNEPSERSCACSRECVALGNGKNV